MLLETYRECLRDFFDMPALIATLADVRSRKIRIATVNSDTPSPFAASLLIGGILWVGLGIAPQWLGAALGVSGLAGLAALLVRSDRS